MSEASEGLERPVSEASAQLLLTSPRIFRTLRSCTMLLKLLEKAEAPANSQNCQDLMIGFANVTVCNQAVISWLENNEYVAVGLQETHLSPAVLHQGRVHCKRSDETSLVKQSISMKSGARVGDLACVARRHRGAWAKHQFLLEGAGYEAIGIQGLLQPQWGAATHDSNLACPSLQSPGLL